MPPDPLPPSARTSVLWSISHASYTLVRSCGNVLWHLYLFSSLIWTFFFSNFPVLIKCRSEHAYIAWSSYLGSSLGYFLKGAVIR